VDDLYVGLMSGTSLDGIDAVLVRFGDHPPLCAATHYRPFPDDLRREALELHRSGADELRRAALLANRLAREYAAAVHSLLADAGVASGAVTAVACHGQTVRHAPADGYTLQLNNPALLAELTGITVIADFRGRDLAAGGQGAPLVPAFHDDLFRHPTRHRVALNIGGIANVTDLPPGRPTRGFDCGPGNMLLDAWTQRHLGKPYDQDGAWAGSGKVLPDLLDRLLGHPFLAAQPPKSCGREQFDLGWLQGNLAGDEAPVDVQATLVQLTARSVARAIDRWCGAPGELFVCGGGAHNKALLAALAAELPRVRLALTDELGLPADWVEAAAFAWLGRRTLLGLPGNLPEVTGARGPRILGAIYRA
jgi:anhydro-N-acetylmuramic acid kinase